MQSVTERRTDRQKDIIKGNSGGHIVFALSVALICIRPAGAPTSSLKGSAVFDNSVLQEILSTSRFHALFSTTAMSFCLAGTPGVIAVVLVTLTLVELQPPEFTGHLQTTISLESPRRKTL
ncbi:hypothetical protein DPMN_137245 [Dreissena polymorpha]|uniref:Uncharacterized protein n=1 Tax=Dreissena polymorpha TaxID=45954 RepID=A0A9D4G4X0_DREPO|nr:hypothetical protein DPMN_137245 [Dreissena polymorpha]